MFEPDDPSEREEQMTEDERLYDSRSSSPSADSSLPETHTVRIHTQTAGRERERERERESE